MAKERFFGFQTQPRLFTTFKACCHFYLAFSHHEVTRTSFTPFLIPTKQPPQLAPVVSKKRGRPKKGYKAQ
jgi:hypothetical protein